LNASASEPSEASLSGPLRRIEWTSGDLNYRAVSDPNDQEFQYFATLMQQKIGK